MKKNQLIFSIMEVVRGQAATEDSGKYVHPQDVEYQISMAYEKAVIDFFANPDLAQNFDLDYFTRTYEETIKKDSAGRLYADLPASPIPVARAQGIKSISPKDSDVEIVRMSEAEWKTMQHLEAFCCSPFPFAYIDFYDKKIILQTNRAEYGLMDKLRIKIIPKFTEYEDTDEINVPSGDYSLVGMVLNIMNFRPTDSTNDDLKIGRAHV